jgi:hypothetical protein
MLCIGYILVDLLLFYVMFVLKIPLNRAVFSVNSGDMITQLKLFSSTIKNYGVNGFYHAATFQRNIILPLAFFISLSCLIVIVRKVWKHSETITARIKLILTETNIMVKQLFLIEFILLVFYCITAL